MEYATRFDVTANALKTSRQIRRARKPWLGSGKKPAVSSASYHAQGLTPSGGSAKLSSVACARRTVYRVEEEKTKQGSPPNSRFWPEAWRLGAGVRAVDALSRSNLWSLVLVSSL